jgi:hypothetical protein
LKRFLALDFVFCLGIIPSFIYYFVVSLLAHVPVERVYK